MKRLYSILLAGVALVAVASCGNRGKKAQVVEITEDGNIMIISCDFVCQAEDADIDNGGAGAGANGVLEFLKTLWATFVRLIGTLLGF